MQVYAMINKIHCLKTLEIVIYILTKNGLLFLQKISNFDILKITLNLVAAIVTDILVVLNIREALRTQDMILTNWMICILLPMLQCTIKGIALLLNKECVLLLLADLKSEAFNNHNEKLNRHIHLIYRISKLVLRYFAFAAIVVVFVFCFLPLLMNMRMMVPPPFKMGRFEIFYKLIHLVFIAYFGTNTACCDVFYMTLIGLGVAQLNILKEQLTHVFENTREIQMLKKKNLDILSENILRKCVILHKQIITFVTKLNKLLAFPLFVQYISGCFIICNTILQMTIMGVSDATILIGLGGYTCITFAQMAIYHWLANEVIFKSNKIIESCYVSHWYKMNIRYQKSLILLMERSQRPLTIQLYGFVNISLDSMGVIIRWSYSIFALIRARYN